ncbi:lipid-A-disaccharide synthase [Ferruginivarius sediminum]|uniref:Lipid-A-disaccharide synthase n=1 Tax=Ferruginivarius sediminum TaxID=2661937 RepID=A0A369TGT5_9PROT|nr:lipid-A-disaccharide synthase [Ferruginivarius sediminum]RDD62126.1 lipid-A-disaccharide synthase [Ferruginivarius sediminum]
MARERNSDGPLIFLVAGEPSGDQLGARLMAALKTETGGKVRFAGVGGERMAREGLQSLFPMEELAVMGLAEVVPHLRRILRRLREVVAAVRTSGADAVVTIDSPSFGLRVLKRLSGIRRPRIHYVAPQVWAWKPWRAKQMAGCVDHLLALLPFEPPIFERHGLRTTFVGHPVVEVAGQAHDGAAFRREHGIPADAPIVCMLPGSRGGEVARLLPVFEETACLLAESLPGLQVVVPTVAGVRRTVERSSRGWTVPVTVVAGTDEKYAAFATSQAAIAASGTVAVELAVAGLPAIIAYRVNPVTAFLARRLIRVRFASLPNLVLDREVQPELLQENCTPDKLAEALRPLLADAAIRADYVRDCRLAAEALGLGGLPPSRRAARAVLETVTDWQTRTGPTA